MAPATKLAVDFAPRQWRGQVAADDDLIALLCVRIGMIMEDVCGDAVMARADAGDELHQILRQLQAASERIFALTQTAWELADRI